MYAVAKKSAWYGTVVCLYAPQSAIAQEFTNPLFMTEMPAPSRMISCKFHDDRSGTETGDSPSFFYILLLIVLPLLHTDPRPLLWSVWSGIPFARPSLCVFITRYLTVHSVYVTGRKECFCML
jgi:hypothetical protein